MDTDTRSRAEPAAMTRVFAPMLLVTGLVACLVIGLFVGLASPAGAEATGTAVGDNQPCLDNVGITVVVDFQELGGGVNVRCAAGPVTDGFDALQKAGISYQTGARSSGFLCKIAGKPADDPCINPSPGGAYWSYWVAARGGSWCYANVGAGARTRPLPPGSVEGWSFSKDKQSTTIDPPRYLPPAAIPGEAPNPIPTADCDAQVTPPPNPGPPATTPTTTAPTPGPSSDGPGATSPTDGGSGTATVSPDAGATSPTPADPARVDSSAPDAVGAAGEAAVDDPARSVALGLVQTNADGSNEALGAVDLASDGSGSSSRIGLVVAGVAAVALAAAGAVVVRRRRAGDP